MRLKTDKKTKDYVKSWLADFPEDISRQAASLTTKFVALGFNNHSDIILLDETFLYELLDMGLTRVQAKRLINDAAALKQVDTEDNDDELEIPPAPVKEKVFPVWNVKLECTHICSAAALLQWLTALLCFVEAQSSWDHF